MGFEFIDENLIRVIDNLHAFFDGHFLTFINLGKGLGALLALFVIAGEAYKVMLLQKSFDFLAIARPIAFAIIISSWTFFVTALAVVPRKMEDYSRSVFYKEQAKVIDFRKQRAEAAVKLAEKTEEKKAAAEMSKEQLKDPSWWEKMLATGKDFLDDALNQFASFSIVSSQSITMWFESLIDKIGQLFWQIMVYLLFFIKEVFSGILIITGPITFGLSVIPAFKDAWSQWIARYISVLLYGFIAYFVLAGAMQIVQYGIESDIDVLTTAETAKGAYFQYVGSRTAAVLMQFVTLCVGGFALRLVPELATWIIPSSTVMGAGSFASGAKSQMTGAVKGVASLATGAK